MSSALPQKGANSIGGRRDGGKIFLQRGTFACAREVYKNEQCADRSANAEYPQGDQHIRFQRGSPQECS